MRMAQIASLLLGGLSLAAAAFAATPAEPTIFKLSWIAGSWASDSAGVRIEEHWNAPKGGMMLGIHRDVIPGRRTAFEFLRIVEDTSGVRYVSQPGGRPATSFPLKELGNKRVVFENPQHDFPQRIIYWLEGTVLCARIEGTIEGKVEGEEWRWRKSTLAP